MSCFQLGHTGHYLIWCPISAKSVKIGLMGAGEELARRGHSVTVVSPHSYKKVPPGVTDIVIKSDFLALATKMTDDMLTADSPPLPPIREMIDLSVESNREAYLHPAVQDIITNQPVDVVIVLPVLGNEAGYYLAQKKNASLVLFLTVPYTMPELSWAIGDPYSPSYMPHPLLGFTQDMTFVQRALNTAISTASLLMRWFYVHPKIYSLVSQVFPGEDLAGIDELLNTASLFINHGTPFTGDGLRPTMPNSILAGLMTCQSPGPLPQDLASFVDSAEHGVVLVSFGSVLQASKMPEHKRKMMLNVFSLLKQRVIWKWEAEMPDAPPNVLVSSWLPQQSLLAHPNVKLFVTHGGAGSFQETICHRTPLVGVPINSDQLVNVKEAVNANIGLSVPWTEMTEEKFGQAVNEVLSSPDYQQSVTELSSLILDQPQHPLDRAVWWLEYLLRHPHNKDMKPHTHNLNWAQYFLVDVIAFVVSVGAIFIFILVKILKCCCSKKKMKNKTE